MNYQIKDNKNYKIFTIFSFTLTGFLLRKHLYDYYNSCNKSHKNYIFDERSSQQVNESI